MIVILAALYEEAATLLRRGRFRSAKAPDGLSAYYSHSTTGHVMMDKAVIVSGAGAEKAKAAAEWGIAEHRPEAVISLGFGGACRDDIDAGDLVLATEVRCLEGKPFFWDMQSLGETVKPSPGLLAAARSAVEVAGIDFFMGRIISLPTVAKTGAMKLWLGQALGAAAVDMESYYVGQAAAAAGVPFLAVRGIVDTAALELPDFVTKMDTGPAVKRLRPVAGHLLRTPSDVGSLARLGRSALRARKSLAAFVDELSLEMTEARTSQVLVVTP